MGFWHKKRAETCQHHASDDDAHLEDAQLGSPCIAQGGCVSPVMPGFRLTTS